MNILIIGNKGYVGRGLMSFWQGKHRLIGWDKEEDIFTLSTHFLQEQKIDVVVNLSVMADRKSALYQLDSPTDRVNVESVRFLARLLKGTKITWIQLSTREVFGLVYQKQDVLQTKNGYRPKWLVHEEWPYHPLNCYAKSKVITEIISESHPFTNIIRLSSCYTDFDHPGGNWVLQIIKNILQGNPVSLSRGGLLFRDPMHVNDLGGLIELLLKKKIYSEKFNAGGGKENFISLLEFVKKVAPNAKFQLTEGEDYGFAFDIQKAYRLAGWKPKVLIRKKIPIIIQNVLKGLINTSKK